MGRRGKGLFRAFKKVFHPDSKHKKGQKSNKSNPERLEQSELFSSEILQSSALDVVSPSSLPLAPASQSDEGKFAEADLEQSKQVGSATILSSTEDPTNFNSSINVTVKSSEEGAAIKIQTAFRGYLARRALRALRGLVRLKSLVHGNAVKRQATTTLRCMQTLARIQSQIRSRRMRMTEENQVLQRQLLLKRERELENLRMSEEWDDSLQSKEQIEAGLLSKQEASIRRERALAYAFSHQWKNSTKSANPTFMDPSNPHWGWSWLERWMAARPWDSRNAISAADKELITDRPSSKGANAAGETGKSGRPDSNLNGTATATPPKAARPPSRQSPGTPPRSKPSKVRSTLLPDDDARSMMSTQSERPRRHSLAAAYSSLKDDDGSLASSPAIPSYMAPTSSARAKSRTQSSMSDGMAGSPERAGSMAPVVKKRLSFPSSPAAARRHSGPPRVDVSITQVAAAPQEPDPDMSNAEEIMPQVATATTVLVG